MYKRITYIFIFEKKIWEDVAVNFVMSAHLRTAEYIFIKCDNE
jgi:hypothetical protein